MSEGNKAMRESWGEGAGVWVENEALFDHLYGAVSDAVMTAAVPGSGTSVLDVGCGTGTLLEAASRAGATATGVDIAPAMVDAAKQRTPEATVHLLDAQTDDLSALEGAPYDVVVSRFGVMFFADPVAAFANLRAAAPDGRLVFGCWRSLEENQTFTLGTDVLLAELDDPPTPARSDAPGPMSLAEPDRIREVLTGGGWHDITIDPLDFVCDYASFRGTDGVEERVATVLGSAAGRMARRELEPRLGEEGWQELIGRVRDAVRAAARGGPLRLPAATWLVQAS